MGRHCANCDAISSITCSIQRKAAAAGKAQIDGHILNSIFMQILQLPFTFPKSQRVSVSYSGMCLPASVMSHICHLFQTHPTPPTPQKKRIVKIKPISWKWCWKARQNQYCWTTHITNRKCLFCLSFQVPHTPQQQQQQQQSNVEDCHRLTEMFSLNFPFRNIFCFLWSARWDQHPAAAFHFHFFTGA